MSRREKRLRKSRWMSIGKHEKPTDENILQLITPSVLGIVLCMVCLAGMTWAWFTANSTAAVSKIEAADTSANATVMIESPVTADTEGSEAYVVSENADGTYSLKAGKLYTVVLDMQGSVLNGEYCIICGEGESYYTPILMPNDEFIFYICPNTDSIYSITTSWGELPSSANKGNILSDGDLIGNEPAANEAEAVVPSNTQEGNTDGTDTVSGLGSERTDTSQEESDIPFVVPSQNAAALEDENNPNGTDDDTNTDGEDEVIAGTDTSQDVNSGGDDGLGDTAEQGLYSDQTEEFSPTN